MNSWIIRINIRGVRNNNIKSVIRICFKLEAYADNTFDIIVSNPPYIDPDDPRIHSDGLKYEPIHALISDQKGLKDIETIICQSKEVLVNKGSLFIEHGHDQSGEVELLLEKYNFSDIRKFQDLNGDDRVCSGKIFKC